MSLKAGRVGVNPADVDPIDGHINSSATGAYTKQEADDKFQTKLSFDDVPVNGSNNPVKSDGIFDIITDVYGVIGKNGAKNKIPFDLATIKANNTEVSWGENSYTYQGVTFTINTDNDGNITDIDVDGTATGNVALILYPYKKYSGDLILSGCTGGSSTTYELLLMSSSSGDLHCYNGETSVSPLSDRNYQARILVKSGVSLSHQKFYPMLRDARDIDSTYQPYAMTNRELTDVVTMQESECTDIVSGATVNTNAMGNHLVKVGNVVSLHLSLSAVTVNAWSNIAEIPNGFKPKYPVRAFNLVNGKTVQISANGILQSSVDISNEYFDVFATWITE